MLKHRIYILFAALVALMFIICQMLFLNLIWNDKRASNSEMLAIEVSQISETGRTASVLQSYCVVSSNQSADNFNNVKKALDLLRFPYTAYSSFDELPQPAPAGLTAVIVCDSNLDAVGDMGNLIKYLELKIKVYFINMLDTSAAVFRQYSEVFGVKHSLGTYVQEGIDFLDEVLVTGLEFNAKITSRTNRFKLTGKCKILAVGYDETIERYNEKNPMIWRTYYKDGGAMFFFNADFMSDFKLAGILTGVLSLNEDVFIYPVINTSIVILDGLPYLSTENTENLRGAYLRTSEQFQCDVLWNDLAAISKNLGIKYTLYPTIGSGREELEENVIRYFGKEVYLNKFELGYYPNDNLSSILPNYVPVTQMHYESGDGKGRVISDEFDFKFEGDKSVTVPIVASGHIMQGADRIRSFSVASAFGYISHRLAVGDDIFKNESTEDIWTEYKLKFTQNLYPVIKLYEYLERETVVSASGKISTYLNCVPQIETNSDSITIKSQPAGSTSYMLRTNRKITGAENCTIDNIRADFYFITVGGKDAVIRTTFE